MVDLAKLVVKMEADSARLQKDLDKANNRLDRFGKNAKRTGDQIKKVFGGIAIALGIQKVFAATQQQENAQRQLENALRRTGNAVGYTQKQLQDYASSLQKVTTVGDEEIIKLESQLLSFGNIVGEQFARTIATVLDFAEVTGRDASTSMRTLAVAINDPLNGMSRLRQAGISLTNSQQDVIKKLAESGDMAGAQTKLLDALDSAYGGAARAAKNTLSGALESLRNAFGDLMEAKTGLPAAAEEINKLTDLLQDPATASAFDSVASGIIAIGRGAAWTVNALAELGRAIGFVSAYGKDQSKSTSNRFDPTMLEMDADQLQKAMENNLKSGFLSNEAKKKIRDKFEAQIKELRDRAQKLRDTAHGHQLYSPADIGPPPDLTKPSLPTRTTAELGNVNNKVKESETIWKTLNDVTQQGFDQMKAFAEEGQKVFDETRDPAEQLNVQIERLNELLDGGAISWDTYSRAVFQAQDQYDQATTKTKELNQAAQDIGYTFTSAFEDAALAGEKFSEVLKGLAKDVARIVLHQAVTKPLGDAVSGFISGFNFGGGKAVGGPVSAGTTYLVGEKGPELFTPSMSGQIIPNGGGSGGVSIVQNISIAANGDKTLQAMVANAARAGAEQGYAKVQNDFARNGPLRRSIS